MIIAATQVVIRCRRITSDHPVEKPIDRSRSKVTIIVRLCTYPHPSSTDEPRIDILKHIPEEERKELGKMGGE